MTKALLGILLSALLSKGGLWSSALLNKGGILVISFAQ
jgi:hypothetical protein